MSSESERTLEIDWENFGCTLQDTTGTEMDWSAPGAGCEGVDTIQQTLSTWELIYLFCPSWTPVRWTGPQAMASL